jgi:lysyl-tRNA synthetase class II
VNIGDFVGVVGFPFKTHTGEMSVSSRNLKYSQRRYE